MHHKRTSRWPTQTSGPIADAPGETWLVVDHALSDGLPVIPGDSSLARLLEEKRGVRTKAARR